MSIARHHSEWLSLLNISGPFLSLPVLLRTFPQGLDVDDPRQRALLRAAYEEWRESQSGLIPDPTLQRAWVQWVLQEILEIPKGTVQEGGPWSVTFAEYGETLQPDFAVIGPPDPFSARPPDQTGADGKRTSRTPSLLVQIVPAGQALDKRLKESESHWKASPATRMMTLLHRTQAPLGLATNGEQWMLIHARSGESTGFISWYTELWLDEPLTLRAFCSLLGVRRFFGVPEEQRLPALLAAAAEEQHEVTDQLGLQVRRAVELLIQSMERADQVQQRSLLHGMHEPHLYTAAVTVMMRLVFLLSAEERHLLPLDNHLYARYYAVSTLREQLQEVADRFGEEILERRHDAWRRLLATFRAVHAGIHHDQLPLPAYGGSLFDPHRFPFLEGHLPIDNRTVLHILDSLQMLQAKVLGGERQATRVSFRALDIEQIGHVYEGLLDHTAVRAETPVLGLTGSKNKEPEVALPELERFFSRQGEGADDENALLSYLKEQTGRSASAVRNALHTGAPDPFREQRLRSACDNDAHLLRRVLPFHGLIRDDDRGYPVVICAGAVYVTAGSERRATGTHYTPRSLTESIVQHALEPLVYRGPAFGRPKEEWQLRSPGELLDLKICDMAMGSGAFLVQACRYLSERLLESMANCSDQELITSHRSLATEVSYEERLELARRLVAERCLYGVDKNPQAVEMAKLSLWLITLAKGKPFTFLDHSLKCGDSLMGIHHLDQLRFWHLHPQGGRAQEFAMLIIEADIDRMIAARREIEGTPARNVEDQKLKEIFLAEADAIAHDLKRNGDMLVGVYYNSLKKEHQKTLRKAMLATARDGADVEEKWRQHADLGANQAFHWPLEFPEVFLTDAHKGFDAIVGNPPFVGGRRIRRTLGDNYREYLNAAWPEGSANADYSAYFFLRGFANLRSDGTLGLIATNTIAQGDTRLTGLAKIEEANGTIYRAVNNQPWPGQAAVVVNVVHITKGTMEPPLTLDNHPVQSISSQLDAHVDSRNPLVLAANASQSFQGAVTRGMGFVITPAEAELLIAQDPRNAEVVKPYLNGQDLNSHPEQQPGRYTIDFRDWPLSRAETYPGPMRVLKERVYPTRMGTAENRKVYKKIWWQFWRPRIGLFTAIAQLKRVLVVALTSKYLSFTFVPSTWVYAHACGAIALDSFNAFAILQSTYHDTWARQYASSLETRLRYTPQDVFETFPFPQSLGASSHLITTIGAAYHEHRAGLMRARQEGLTTTYNRFQAPDESATDIARLRALHEEMDKAVAAAYGWEDLHLGHGFYVTAQGVRFTISEEARRAVLNRLLELNHQRYSEEVAAGLHGKK